MRWGMRHAGSWRAAVHRDSYSFGALLLFMSKFQDCAGAAEIRLSLIL